VMVCMVFGVLFGFRRSDFRSSDLLPSNQIKSNLSNTILYTVKTTVAI
jgi:hypothetical protein